MTAVPSSLVSRFALLVERHLGLAPDDGRWRELESVLEERAAGDVMGYLGRLASAPEPGELRALAERLTVGETYFLRHPAQLDALVDDVLPSLLRQNSTVHILSAGCSTGEEAYSVALLSRERGRVDAARLRLLGIDVNPRALEIARRACYSPWALRAVTPAMRQRWFQRTPEGFALSPKVREKVVFEERNLMAEASAFWAPGSFQVILCRNVLLYFAPEMVRQIIGRMAQALVPGGYLFLGPSETLRGISEEFDLVRDGDAFYYRKKDPAALVTRLPAQPATLGPLPEKALSPPPSPPPPPPDGLQEVVRLLEQERHGDAWEKLEALPADARDRAGLLRAVLHLHAGRSKEAERLGRELAASGSERAEAYYLLGVCGEQAGDEAAARARYTEALRVDPTFALAQLRIGSLARRAGDLAGARVALRMALSLLPREKALHLSLFGGGFGRHGLMQLGLRELQACSEAEGP